MKIDVAVQTGRRYTRQKQQKCVTYFKVDAIIDDKMKKGGNIIS